MVTLAALLVASSVTAPRVEKAPHVDCSLADPVWAIAAVTEIAHQAQPGDNTAPSRRTTARFAYTRDALHIAIDAEDDAALVKSTLAARDAIASEDHIALYLDTFHDRKRAYVFMVNAKGVQQDGLLAEGREPDYSVDIVFQSAGCVTATGYSIEISIPFSSLRYQAGEGRSWGLHVLRLTQRAGEEDSWVRLRRDRTSVDGTSTRQLRARFLSQAGTLEGLQGLPHVPVIEAMPTASASRIEGGGSRTQIGGTARVSLTSSATLDLAANPDFAEIEADAPQSTANQRFPLFYPEKRPFFLEGADLLATPIRAFHSRTILDPDGALKLTETRGRLSIAALVAVDPGPGRFSSAERDDPQRSEANSALFGRRAAVAVLRARRDIGFDSSVGLLATSWSFAGRRNQVGGLDGRFALGSRTTWTFQALASVSRMPFADAATGAQKLRDGAGFGYLTDLSRTGRQLSVQVVGEGYTPDYRSALGYTQRSDTNRWSVISRYDGHPAKGPFLSWSLANTVLTQFDWKGRAQYGYIYPRLLTTMKRQTYLNLAGYRDYVRVFEEEFGLARTPSREGAFIGKSERSSWYHGFTVDAGSSPTRTLSIAAAYDRSWNNLDLDLGAGRFPRVSPAALLNPEARLDPGPADSRSLSGSLTLQPSATLRFSQTYEWNRLTRQDTGRDAYRQHLLSSRVRFSFTRFAWVRGRLDYDSLDRGVFHQVVLGWTPKPGRAVYVGYDETGEWLTGPETASVPRVRGYARRGRTIFAKVSWSRVFGAGRPQDSQ